MCACSLAEVSDAFSSIIWHIQRHCCYNSQPQKPEKIFSTVWYNFLDLLSYKVLNWLGYMCFLVIPLGSHPEARNLGSLHHCYKSFFQDLL